MKKAIYTLKHALVAALPILCGAGAGMMISCSDWDDHYDEAELVVNGNDVQTYNGTIVQYIQSAGDLSQMNSILNAAGVYGTTSDDGSYTYIVCPNSVFDASRISNNRDFALYSVSDMAVNPAKLVAGSCLKTRQGKSLWVYENGGRKKLDDYDITKVVKCLNGYVYYLDGTLSVRASAYEFLNALGDDYSTFKDLVKKYEYKSFDRENSQQTGVNNEGRPTYDSVFVVKNTLMDRYDAEGNPIWDMRSESFSTTMFIPDNQQIAKAIEAAMDSIPVWLQRPATDADRAKFEEWVVKACFSDVRHVPAEVDASIDRNITCVSGYKEVVDEATDQVSYQGMDPAYWRPSVQKVDIDNAVTLSNGMAYFCKQFKIPNHIVIYRVKSRMYELWNSMTNAQQEKYFRWDNWEDPMVIENAQKPFDLVNGSTDWPSIFYHELCAVPSKYAMDNEKPCSVEYDGLLCVDDNIYECHLPAGEYYLRMGFKHSLKYSLSIEFNGTATGETGWVMLKEDMPMQATGSDYHFDRGAASEVPHYGTDYGIAYPEGFDVDYWQNFDAKAIAYDTDGTTVGIANIVKSGNFRIRVTSNDMARIYKAAIEAGYINPEAADKARNNSNVYQLMMYHWCLRPTPNNY